MESNRVAKAAYVLLLVVLLVSGASLDTGGMGRVTVSASVIADPPMIPPPPQP